MFVCTVLPPVLVPRNPQVITSVYEPIPSYLDSGRASYSPNNDVHPLNFDTPGEAKYLAGGNNNYYVIILV